MSSGRVAIAVCACLVGGQAVAAPTTEEKLDILTQEVEQLKAELNKSGRAPSPAGKQMATPAHAHGRAPTTAEGRGIGQTFVGSYGEMHYNNLESKQEIDFHRFVLFFGHNFTDKIRFFSELELEHSFAKDTATGTNKGEVELEQGYVEIDLNQNHAAKAGLFLIPVGIINETHEPPTFYGVERNPVEGNIIPTTWWEGGLGLSGKLGAGLGYDVALTSGLKTPTTGGNAYLIRSGRQKVSEANADDGALTTRLRWTGIPGVELAATVLYQDDIAQANGGAAAASAMLVETHAAINKGPFGLRALYARWDIDGDAAATGASPGRDKQLGWYVEPSFKVSQKLGVFARYAEWDNNAGSAAAPGSDKDQTNVGVNYWPHENVVFKADVQQQGKNGSDDGFNLGVGYMF